MCASLYAHFLHSLQDASYYPSGAEQISDNLLFGMFHSCTDEHNKRVIMSGLIQIDGVVRVVFATMALDMEESGRAGRDHQKSQSRIFCKPVEAPLYADQSVHLHKELKAVIDYLENTKLFNYAVTFADPVFSVAWCRCGVMMNIIISSPPHHLTPSLVASSSSSYDQAMCEFVSAIQLDPTLAEAHINCGLLFLLHRRNTPRAIDCFSQALAVQPTSVVVLLCRAEA
ncbi:hypothetical protein EMCRGX_G026733 [Ephydatia muelleri]